MSIIAFIPARGGSKSIPNKNIKLFCGKPLIFWNLKELQDSCVDEIVVATDSVKIKKVVNSFSFSKVKVYERLSENANDDSSTESVMLEYINHAKLHDNDTLMLVQITSPYSQTIDFDKGLDVFRNYDSVLSCCVSKKFIWDKKGISLNYDFNNRPRRQDNEGSLIENGAFYISSVKDVTNSKNRISGHIGIYQMPEYTFTELDEPLDWIIAENIMREFVLADDLKDYSDIKIFISDVDGVLTDGFKYYNENLEESVKFSTHDGYAFKLLKDRGLLTGIVTSETKKIKSVRFEKLKSLKTLDYFYQGVNDKLSVVKGLCSELNIDISNVAYIGDDVNCLNLLENVGLAACPANAVDAVKNIKNIIVLNKNGGEGVFREFVDLFINKL